MAEKYKNLLLSPIPFSQIERVEIVQLGGLTMNQWYNRQTDKPKYMLNASLWDNKGPIGTIWLGGELVRNEGTGYGFGTHAGGFSFGDPWNTKWENYITGYPALIQSGNKTTISVDSYVQNSVNRRSAICKKGNTLYLVTGKNLKLNSFRNQLADYGMTEAINLDGGGSSRLLVDGVAINDPTDNRACKLAIAVWAKGTAPSPTPDPVPELKPGQYKTRVNTYVNLRDGIGTSASSVGKLTNGLLLNVTEVKDGWGKTVYNGKTGWFSLKYATRVGDLPTAPHWAQKCLDSLVAKGIITDPTQWDEFDQSASKISIGQLLALVDKMATYRANH